ncbi:DUF302 domain-containing protein [Granulosicoccus sp. 3-233]|uniref:DUF302 domain-containing protein n=1 Tax=Granulosicoccus sp. 3-233 TaxID=3417969 RepID=UPI003D35598F
MSSALIKGAILCTSMATAFISGCSSDDDADTDTTGGATASVDGLVAFDSARPVGEAMGALLTALNNNDAITALPLIDHQANAAGIGETLRPTSVQLFGNPALGTPLMQVNQLAGLDLPQKILAWENEEGDTQIAYNSADYLQQRHAIVGDDSADAALQTIAGALDALSFNASGNTEEDSDAEPLASTNVSAGEGIITVTSTQDMDSTYNTLVSAIQNAEPLLLVRELDHAANAESVEMDLNPTRLVIFGNPNAGTPLMQIEQSIGIDLPQKMLVFEDDGGVVTIAYNDPAYLAERHGIEGEDARLATISAALAGLASTAAGTATAE